MVTTCGQRAHRAREGADQEPRVGTGFYRPCVAEVPSGGGGGGVSKATRGHIFRTVSVQDGIKPRVGGAKAMFG